MLIQILFRSRLFLVALISGEDQFLRWLCSSRFISLFFSFPFFFIKTDKIPFQMQRIRAARNSNGRRFVFYLHRDAGNCQLCNTNIQIFQFQFWSRRPESPVFFYYYFCLVLFVCFVCFSIFYYLSNKIEKYWFERFVRFDWTHWMKLMSWFIDRWRLTETNMQMRRLPRGILAEILGKSEPAIKRRVRQYANEVAPSLSSPFLHPHVGFFPEDSFSENRTTSMDTNVHN